MMAVLRNLFRRSGTGCQGMTAVEMALVLPVLLVTIFGLIEMSNLFQTWLTLQKAAQTGARFAATGQGEIEGNRLSQIQQVTESKMTSLPDGGRVINVRSWPSEIPSGAGVLNDAGEPCQMVEVEIEYSYELILGSVMAPILPETIPLTVSDQKINEPWKPCGS